MNANEALHWMEHDTGIMSCNDKAWPVVLRALRLLAAAEGGDGTPETDAELATHKVRMENGGYCYTEPWSGLVTGRFARSLETQRNALAARVAELEPDAERLDWLMRNMTGRSLRECVGELADTGDIAEFRAAIDAARSEP